MNSTTLAAFISVVFAVASVPAGAQQVIDRQKGHYIEAAPDAGPPDREEEARVGTLSIMVENDYFVHTDQNYTNGLRVQYLRPKGHVSDLTAQLTGALSGVGDEGRIYESISFGQSLFTPRDITDPNPIAGDHPYAGWLYLELAGVVDDVSHVDTVSITAGIVGPLAGGELVQNTFHQVIDSEIAQGWDNQLNNEPGLMLNWERTWRVGRSLREYWTDVLPTAGVSLGNVLTEARAGVMFRFGPDLQDDLGPPRIRPSLAGSGFLGGSPDFNWYLFSGIQARGVLRNIFLDGNSFSDSLSVEKRPFVFDTQAGLALHYRGLRLSYSLVRRSREFETQLDPHYFAAFALTMRY